jgi:negative regulator of flagellin synthesis FlgM
MKISPSSPTNPTTSADATQTGATAARAGAPAVDPAPSSASIELSAASRALQASGADTGVDLARVGAIQQAISEGRFKVDTGVVADKLIASVKELLARP